MPSAWLLAAFPDARTFSLDPDEKRVFIASRAIGPRGTAVTGSAPDLPKLSCKFDTALMLDMAHYLSDEDLRCDFKVYKHRHD